MERTRVSWLRVAVAMGLALILFLVTSALLGGVLATPFDASFWRAGLLYCAVTAHILLMLPALE